MVTEYPSQELLRYYRTHDKNVDLKINTQFKKKFLIKKKSFNKTTMSLQLENNDKDVKKELSKLHNTLDIDDTLKLNNLSLDLYNFDKEINDISNLESLTIRDSNLNTCNLYISNHNTKLCLINSNKKFISQINEWIDDEDEVPNEYKNADNIVLHPVTRIPIIEVKINNQMAIFCNICPGIYREYEFLEDLETFRSTNQILRN